MDRSSRITKQMVAEKRMISFFHGPPWDHRMTDATSANEAGLGSKAGLVSTDILRMLLVATLVMAAGWGIRGAFGHSRGAMMPGAMLGLTLAVCSRRSDWWQRAAIIGFLSAIGWGFGGASSYGQLIGYAQKPVWSISAYGYVSLFLVGALYSGIGGACLGIALTARRSFLESAVWPLALTYGLWLLLEWFGVKAWSLELFAKDPARPEVTAWLYDSLWICAVSSLMLSALLWPWVRGWRRPLELMMLLSVGWLAGMALLVGLLGLRINPSRADSWAGCVGILIAFLVYFYRQRNRAAILLCSYGLISGGFGFVVGQFVQALGRGRWGVIGTYPVLQEFGYWTIMEQIFGAFMGFGIAWGVVRLIRGGLEPSEEDVMPSHFNFFAVFSLFGLIPVFNLITNFSAWRKAEVVPELVLGIPSGWILSGVAVVWLILVGEALRLYRAGRLDVVPSSTVGKARWLALAMCVLVLTLYALLPAKGLPTSLCFIASLFVSAWLLLHASTQPMDLMARESRSPQSAAWRLSWGHGFFWLAAPILICLLAYATTQLNIPR
jgi:hypothetical protein